MTSNIETAIFKAKINGELKDIFFNTGIDNIIITEEGSSITLSQKLADIVASLNSTLTLDAVETKISDAIAAVVDSAPESLDTLRELAEAITDNASLMDSLNDLISSKVSAKDGFDLISTSLVDSLNSLDFDALASLTSDKIASFESGQENVIESISVNGSTVTIIDKSVDISVPSITISSDEPSSLNDGDLFLQIISDSAE